MQLFVVPGLLIAVVVLIVLGMSYLGRRDRAPEYFLEQLDSDNAEIRKRGMYDLAQILKRNEPAVLRWKIDAKFALDLAQRLDRAFNELLEEEKKIAAQIAESTDKDKDLRWRKLRGQRDYISFLASALGEFHIPAGVPALCALLKNDQSPDVKGNTLQRRKALISLVNLGTNVKEFAKLPAEKQQHAVAVLHEEAVAGAGARAAAARTALYYLDRAALPADAGQDIVKADETLAFCADADDPFLRELTAMAFNFWDGEQARATLLKLSMDDGHGTLLRVEEND